MSPSAVENMPAEAPGVEANGQQHTSDATLLKTAYTGASSNTDAVQLPQILRFDANSPETTASKLVEILHRDGGVIVENLISQELAMRIKAELKPCFDGDRLDRTGFFPTTTQRAHGLLAVSDGCAELLTVPLWIDVANTILSDTFNYWYSQELQTVTTKPVISSTVGFRVNPGGKQQVLHRDDSDYHARDVDMPMMMGCVTALTNTTKENGATVMIPGSHKWGMDRMPFEHEAVPAELKPGDACIFLGNTYHGGGGNITKDEVRETVGMFLCKSMYRQVENEYLMVPPEKAKRLSPQVLRLLGYGISKPNIGFYQYQDPMRVIFGIEDEETVDM